MLAQLDPNLLPGLILAGFFLLDILFMVLFALSLGKSREDHQPPRRAAARKPSTVVGIVLGLVFLVSWSLVTLAWDVKLVRGLVYQIQALHHPSVEGRVVTCAAKEEDGGES